MESREIASGSLRTVFMADMVQLTDGECKEKVIHGGADLEMPPML